MLCEAWIEGKPPTDGAKPDNWGWSPNRGGEVRDQAEEGFVEGTRWAPPQKIFEN